MSDKVVYLTSVDFDKQVEGKAVLIDFWADWCGPCKMLLPVIDALAEKLDGKVVVAKVNVDENEDLAEKFAISSIPALKLLVDGKEVDAMVGFRREAQILEMIQKHINI